MLNATHTISRRPVNLALQDAVFRQDDFAMSAPRFLSRAQPVFEPFSDDTAPARLPGNVFRIAPDGRSARFFREAEFVHKMEAIKASAKAGGDRSCEALAIASLALYRLVNNKNTFAGAIRKWAGRIDRSAILKNLPYIRRTNKELAAHIHSISQWRLLKQGPEAVRAFARKRVDLAERMKAVIPREASAWAISQISDGDLNSYLPEILKTRSFQDIGAIILDRNSVFLPTLAKKIAQLDDMESWTEDHLIDTLIGFKEIRSMLTDELYRVTFSIYATAATSLWTFIDQHEPIEDCVPREFEVGSGSDPAVAGGFDLGRMIAMVGSIICESDAWGDFAPFIRTIFDLNSEARVRLLEEISRANAVVWRVGQELIEEQRLNEIALKNTHKDKKHASIDMAHARAQIANLNRQVGEMRKARAKPGLKQDSADISVFEEELRLSKKNIDQIQDELGKKQAELKQVYALLDSVLPTKCAEGGQVFVKLSPSVLIEKRGVIIGGHCTLIAKLRKELTNCQFYSPDAKSLDDEAVRNCEYILFFADYVNHCLAGHALRLSRLYNIPCGYTHRTNVPLVLKDIEMIFAGNTLIPETDTAAV